jgi:hypothetical protein
MIMKIKNSSTPAMNAVPSDGSLEDLDDFFLP